MKRVLTITAFIVLMLASMVWGQTIKPGQVWIWESPNPYRADMMHYKFVIETRIGQDGDMFILYSIIPKGKFLSDIDSDEESWFRANSKFVRMATKQDSINFRIKKGKKQ